MLTCEKCGHKKHYPKGFKVIKDSGHIKTLKGVCYNCKNEIIITKQPTN